MSKDKRIVCVDCGADFTFSIAQQKAFANKGFREPCRCPDCLLKRRERQKSFRRIAREGSYRGHCDSCGASAYTHFKPKSNKKVYCNNCLHDIRSFDNSQKDVNIVYHRGEYRVYEHRKLRMTLGDPTADALFVGLDFGLDARLLLVEKYFIHLKKRVHSDWDTFFSLAAAHAHDLHTEFSSESNSSDQLNAQGTVEKEGVRIVIQHGGEVIERIYELNEAANIVAGLPALAMRGVQQIIQVCANFLNVDYLGGIYQTEKELTRKNQRMHANAMEEVVKRVEDLYLPVYEVINTSSPEKLSGKLYRAMEESLPNLAAFAQRNVDNRVITYWKLRSPSQFWEMTRKLSILCDVAFISSCLLSHDDLKYLYSKTDPAVANVVTKEVHHDGLDAECTMLIGWPNTLLKWAKDAHSLIANGRVLFLPIPTISYAKYGESQRVPVMRARRWFELMMRAVPDDGWSPPRGLGRELFRLKLPFIEEISFDVLAKVINDEQDSLRALRIALLRSVKEAKDLVGGDDVDRRITEIQSDLIDCEVARLGKRLKAVTEMRALKIAGCGLATVVLSLAAVLMHDVDQFIVPVVGVGGGIYELLRQVAQFRSELSEIRTDPFWLLWKLGNTDRYDG